MSFKKPGLLVVAAVLRNSDGHYFMAQKSRTSSQPLHWEFPGGKVESGESEQQALRREINEELDVLVIVGSLLKTVEGEVHGQRIQLRAYECHLEDQEASFRLKEHVDMGWFDLAKMQELTSGPLDSELIKHFKSNVSY